MEANQAKSKLISLLTGISLQTFIVTALCFSVAAATLSLTYGFFIPAAGEAVAQVAEQELSGLGPNSFQSLKLMNKYNLAWLYVTDSSHQPTAGTKSLAPYLPNYPNKSRKLTYRGESYFEATRTLKDSSQTLHLGFSLESGNSALHDVMGRPAAALLLPMRLGAIGNVCLIVAMGLSAWITLLMAVPLTAMSKGLSTMVKENKVNLEAFEKLPRSPLMVAELGQLFGAIKGVFIYLSTQERSSQEAQKGASERAAKWLKPKTQEDKLEQTMGRSVSNRLSDLVQDRSNSPNTPLGRGFIDLLKANDSTGNYTEEMSRQIMEQFKDKLSGVVLLKPDNAGDRWLILSQVGLNLLQVQTLNAMDLSVITAPLATAAKINNLGPMSLKRSGLDTFIGALGARFVITAPIRHNNRTLACALLLAREQFTPEALQTLERTCVHASAIYHGLLLAEEAKEQVWVDALTGLKNKSFIKELTSAMSPDQTYYFCHVDVDTRENLNNNELEVVAVDAARIIKATLSDFQSRYSDALSGVEIGRLQKTDYAVLVKSESPDWVNQLANTLQKALSNFLGQKVESVAIGIASFPRDGQSDELMNRARLASFYAQEQPEGNRVARVQAVPAEFKPRRRAAAMQGELGVLDASELIQSLLIGQRSGILTVDEGSRHMQLALAGGRLISAQMGQFRGFNAIIEFLSTVESGTFNFQETQALPAAAEPNPIPPITRCLMEAALAQDYLIAARNSIQDLTSPVVAVRDEHLWQDMLRSEEISPQEQSLLTYMLNRADGSTNLEQIIKELEQVPTAYRWRAAALLVNYGLLEKSILSRT